MKPLLAIVLWLSVNLLVSCEYSYTPKKKGYPRVVLPEHEYQEFDMPGFPYSFEYPSYAEIIRDTVFFDEPTENPFWINIDYPSLGGRIYLSYKYVNAKYPIARLVNDAFDMTYKHAVRADAIMDRKFQDPEKNKYAVFYNVKGNAATAHQFYVTDSVRHFLRGALYFDVTPNADSLRIVNDFLQEDMQHLIETLEWH